MENKLSVVDSHLHVWDLDKFTYEWPRKVEEKVIFRNFLPADYQQEMKSTPVKAAVFVEVHESLEEIEWVLQMADTQYPFIKGVVGYVDLTSSDFEQHILRLKQNPKFVGIRKIWSEPDWIEREDVITGLEILGQNNLTFDLLIKSREQYNSVKRFLKRVPANLKIVLDHLGKPDAKSGADQWWFDDITTIASYPNVYCKLSGMVTEADLTNWKASNFTQHVNHVMQQFGIDRVMFGSDWPVCKMACANLPEAYNLLDSILNKLTQNEKPKVFCENAINFYNLKLD